MYCIYFLTSGELHTLIQYNSNVYLKNKFEYTFEPFQCTAIHFWLGKNLFDKNFSTRRQSGFVSTVYQTHFVVMLSEQNLDTNEV